MAEVGHQTKEAEVRANAFNTTFTDIAGHDLSAGGLDASADYVMIVKELVMGSSSAVNDFQFRLTGAGITPDESYMRFEPQSTTSTYGHHYFYIERVLTPDPSTALQAQGGNVSTTSLTMRGISWHGMAIKLADLASADYGYFRSNTTYSLDNSFWRNGANSVIGDGSSDYVVFVHVQGNANTVGAKLRWKLNIGATEPFKYNELESEDSLDQYQVGGMYFVSNPGVSQTAAVVFQTNSATSGSWSSERSTIFWMRLNAFEQYKGKFDTATVALTTADTEFTSVSNPFLTSNVGARRWFVGSSHVYQDGGTNELVHRYLRNGASKIFGEGTDVAGGMKEMSNGQDRKPVVLFGEIGSITASTSINLHATVESEARTDSLKLEGHLIAFTWEKATPVIDRTVGATAQALVISEQAAGVNATRGVAATAQALLIAEQAATAQRVRTIAATSQALAISEAAANINRQRGLDATVQALLITEIPASVALALDRTVQATTQALTITEFAASVTGVPRTVSAAVQALLVSEYQAIVTTDPAWSVVGDASDDWSAVGSASSNWNLVADANTTWQKV